MSSQDERERALLSECVELAAEALAEAADPSAQSSKKRALFWEKRAQLGHAGHARAEREQEATYDAAAARAEIAAELRARATSEDITATRAIDGGHGTDGRVHDHAARVLRELADRIEAARPRPAEPSADLLRAVAEAVREEALSEVTHGEDCPARRGGECSAYQCERASIAEMDLAAIIATVRARPAEPTPRLYTREEAIAFARVVRLIELGEIDTDDAGTRGPALNPASLSRARIEAAKVAQIVADASEGAT